MTDIRHIIIAGSNKCGTTSLYRYLCDHPAVCGSIQKETGFFHRNLDYTNSDSLNRYTRLFPGLANQHSFCLEATPSYLDSGKIIATRINDLIGDPHIVLLLRDPTDRLVSYYRSKHGLTTSVIAGLSFTDFVEKAMNVASNPRTPTSDVDEKIGRQISKAYYSQFVEEYLQVIPLGNLHILFFEFLRDEPLSIIQSLCNSIGLDSSFYDDYVFHVENRSRIHRSAKLRTITSTINLASEPLLNHLPWLRRTIRTLYNKVNTVQGERKSFDSLTLQKTRNHFRPHNDSLRALLEREMNIEEFPEWLTPS